MELNAASRLIATDTRDVWEIIEDTFGMEELSRFEKVWWADRLDEPKTRSTTLKLIAFLNSVSSGYEEMGMQNVGVPSASDIAAFKKLYTPRKYPKLWRGMGVPDPSKLRKGQHYDLPNKRVSFWSQDRKHAELFGDHPGEVLLSCPYQESQVIVDLNVVPFVLGDAGGREPEILLKPDTITVTVVKVNPFKH